MLVKAISIVAPSGRRIASGEKTLEVRRWLPNLDAGEDLLIVENQRFLEKAGDYDPDGYAVALVRIGRVRPFTRDDMKAACASYFEDGWLAWEITHMRPLEKIFQVVAARKIYSIDVESECLIAM